MKNILVTGGLGFIGSNTCIKLIENKYNLFIIDSLANSSLDVLENINLIKSKLKNNKILKFFLGDIRNEKDIQKIFSYARKNKLKIDMVIHFAGVKSVSDSERNPKIYWDVNYEGSKTLIKVMNSNQCFSIVFSSSATIYGQNTNLVLNEESLIKPFNTYGETKSAVEKYLQEKYRENPQKWNIINLRYFNPVGAHPSGLLRESLKNKPQNIFPLLCMAALNQKKIFEIYGKDWDTPDGTAIRDYIHVLDLAEAHLNAIKYLTNKNSGIDSINLGTGEGISVLELLKTFEKVNNTKIKYKFTKKRKGDVARYVASNSLAWKLLKWQPKLSLERMCKDGWLWYLAKEKNSLAQNKDF